VELKGVYSLLTSSAFMNSLVVSVVMDLTNTLPGNSSVNTNRHNNRRETVFYAIRSD
jgi:hypothetical protein